MNIVDPSNSIGKARREPWRVYWNLHKDCWSLLWYVRGKGYRLCRHIPHGWGTNITFKVSEAGRQRVIATGRKNVHAYAEVHGALYQKVGGPHGEGHRTWERVQVRYNPYEGPHFTTLGGTPLKGLNVVHFTSDGRLVTDERAFQHIELLRP